MRCGIGGSQLGAVGSRLEFGPVHVSGAEDPGYGRQRVPGQAPWVARTVEPFVVRHCDCPQWSERGRREHALSQVRVQSHAFPFRLPVPALDESRA